MLKEEATETDHQGCEPGKTELAPMLNLVVCKRWTDVMHFQHEQTAGDQTGMTEAKLKFFIEKQNMQIFQKRCKNITSVAYYADTFN